MWVAAVVTGLPRVQLPLIWWEVSWITPLRDMLPLGFDIPIRCPLGGGMPPSRLGRVLVHVMTRHGPSSLPKLHLGTQCYTYIKTWKGMSICCNYAVIKKACLPEEQLEHLVLVPC